MSKPVHFSNKGYHVLYAEAGPVNSLIPKTPVQFANAFDDHAKVVLLDHYCSLFPQADTANKPYIYFRHTDVARNKYRFGNIVDLGDEPFVVQKGVLHPEESATSETPIDQPYGWIENGVLGFESKDKVSARYYRSHATIKEGDYLDLTAYPWEGFTLYDHQSTYENCSCVFQPSTYVGCLDGQPVIGLGSFDRLCMKQHTEGGFGTVPLAYIAISLMGIRKDGRREFCNASLGLSEGARSIVAYKIDGDEMIITDEVSLEADWMHLPYVDDGTCVFQNAILRFNGKEIHFEGKWGTKGFLKKPRIERHGQSQIFGTWYEGSEPYEHRLYYTFVENMEAYDKNLKRFGFDVID